MTAACVVARLTTGWRDDAGPATLRDHLRRFGALPGHQHGHDLTEQVAAAGLTGRGGAGFPTAAKMRAVASRRRPAVLVANGMESEPVSGKDQALLARAPHLVLDGIQLAAQAVGASTATVCVPRSRGWLAHRLRAAVSERQHAGSDRVPVRVHELPHNYVSSEETALVHWLNGGQAKPTATPPRPFESGVRKRPTLIDNVETLAHIALIARYGAAWFREAGLADAPGTMLVTVSGAVAEPGVYEIAAGTPVGDVLSGAGVAGSAGAVLIGGYFGSWHRLTDVACLPFSQRGLRPTGASPGAGVLVALPDTSCVLVETARILAFLASQGAQQCGPCLFGLPAVAQDMAQLAAGRPDGDPVERMRRRFTQISGRGACRHPDGAVRLAASALSAFAADAHSHARQRPCRAAVRELKHGQANALPWPTAERQWR